MKSAGSKRKAQTVIVEGISRSNLWNGGVGPENVAEDETRGVVCPPKGSADVGQKSASERGRWISV